MLTDKNTINFLDALSDIGLIQKRSNNKKSNLDYLLDCSFDEIDVTTLSTLKQFLNANTVKIDSGTSTNKNPQIIITV